MLDDRSYMRSPAYDVRRSATGTLIILLIVIFVVQWVTIFYGNISQRSFNQWWALSLEGLKHGRAWQLLTFQFLHTGPWPLHLLGNCLGLFFFGRSVEESIGTRSFLKLYFLSGFFGAALQILTAWLLPNHEDNPMVGASAGVMGLLAAYARLFPMRELTMWIYFFPINVRAIYLFWFSLLVSAFGTLVPFGNIAHGAHLGGLIMGVVFLRWADAVSMPWKNPFQSRRRKRQLLQAASKTVRWRPRERSAAPADLPSEEFISREVDPILDKISAHGIHSLTPREREILEAARAKMAKR